MVSLPPAPVIPGLPFTARALLAPMEGVTETCFRDLVLAENPAHALGGAFTEFARVVARPLPARVLSAHLGPRRASGTGAPVGLQLMGGDPAAVAESARRAFEAGAPLVDLNFGCPAKGAIRGCAGSSLLRDPAALERMVAASVRAAGGRPVSAKIRAGWEDDLALEDLARAVEQGGAALLTVHCRTRAEAYRPEVDWGRISRAVAAVSLPVCGNGGVSVHADLERMRAETGCALVMVGRAALGDPWIFCGRSVDAATAARFLLDYAGALLAGSRAGRAGAAGRVKQLLQHWTAGALVGEDRASWMRERDPERLFERLERAAGGSPSGFPTPRPTRGAAAPRISAPFSN